MECLSLRSFLPFPTPSLLFPPLLEDQARGFPTREPAKFLPVSPRPRYPVGACFGNSHTRDTTPSAEQPVKAGTVEALHSAPLSHGAHAKLFFSKGHWRKLTFGGRIRSLHPSKQVPAIVMQ